MEIATTSHTVAGLEASRRPAPEVVCSRCPNSMWYHTSQDVNCYCKAMYVLTWTSRSPQVIQACDGQIQQQAEMAADPVPTAV